MFDIHCHILPAVDDGSGNLNDSIEMAQLAADSGTKGIIATPHCNIPGVFENYRSAELDKCFETLKDAIVQKNIRIEIYKGHEVFLSGNFEEHLKNGDFVTLNGSRYILAEFDFRSEEATALARVGKLISEGYVPIIAHPERYGFVVESPEAIKILRSMGALVQLNSGSLTGDFGHFVQETADFIVRNGLADFVASDAHSQYSRTPNLARVHELICENYSYDYADILLRTNPLKVLNDEII